MIRNAVFSFFMAKKSELSQTEPADNHGPTDEDTIERRGEVDAKHRPDAGVSVEKIIESAAEKDMGSHGGRKTARSDRQAQAAFEGGLHFRAIRRKDVPNFSVDGKEDRAADGHL